MNRAGRRLAALAAAAWLAGAAGPGAACFGTRLRVSVPDDPGAALAAYAVGYVVEEKTGIEPEFVPAVADPGVAVREGRVDLGVASASAPLPAGTVARPAGDVPGVGPGRLWIRAEVLDDLRFFTVDRALGALPAFFATGAFREAAESGEDPKKAARRAVLHGL